MTYPNFPTISKLPEAGKWQEEAAADPTLRTEFESGYVATRARFTIVPQKWSFAFDMLDDAEKQSIQSFERNTVNYGAGAFNWTNPVDDQIYLVRFTEPVVYKLDSNDIDWEVSMKIVEVSP